MGITKAKLMMVSLCMSVLLILSSVVAACALQNYHRLITQERTQLTEPDDSL